MTFSYLRESALCVYVLICKYVTETSIGLNKDHSTEGAGEQLDWHTSGMVNPCLNSPCAACEIAVPVPSR